MRLRHLSMTLVLILLLGTITSASPRTALVIGNSSYLISPLKNPVNDATDMANTLTRSGFAVSFKINADQRTMVTAIREFGRQIKQQGGVGLFYYAGHGIQVKGRNYLIPLGAVIESEGDVQFEAVDAGFVLSKMEDAGNDMNIVVLDACRNNPFARSFRSSAQGLARMDAPKGSIIAYATAPGDLAADGTGRNGIYTKHLIQNINTPQLRLEDVFKNVRRAVVQETGNQQVPWESSSLMGQFYFSLQEPSPLSQQTPPESDVLNKQAEILFWDSIKNSTDPAMFEAFLLQFPDGIFTNLATIKLTRFTHTRQSAITPKQESTSAIIEKKSTPLQQAKPVGAQIPDTVNTVTDTGSTTSAQTHAVSEKKILSPQKSTAETFAITTFPPPQPATNEKDIIAKDGHFIKYKNGIIHDESTGLEWFQGADKGIGWHSAKSWAKELNIDGGGWEMPSLKQVKTLYDPAIIGFKTSLFKMSGIIWSKDSRFNSFNFGDGSFKVRGSATIEIHQIRCLAVRHPREHLSNMK